MLARLAALSIIAIAGLPHVLDHAGDMPKMNRSSWPEDNQSFANQKALAARPNTRAEK